MQKADSHGRVDVLVESFLGLLIDRISQDSGIPQIQQQLRPILTKRVKRSGLKRVKIPDEILGLGAAILEHGRMLDRKKVEEMEEKRILEYGKRNSMG